MTNFNNYRNTTYINNQKSQKSMVFLLYLSFVWLTFYGSANSIVSNFTLGYGKLLQSSENLFFELFYIFAYALLELGLFEILFWFYRKVLSYKVYTFVVPDDKIKQEFRSIFILRNVILGIVCNICFLYPFLYNAYSVFKVLITLLVVTIFAFNLQKKYSEPIIAHFVFKNFYKPVLVYEVLLGVISFLEVL